MAIRPLFASPFSTLTVAAVVAGLAGCAVEEGPPGGSRPALAAVPERPDRRYDAFERAVLRDALAAAAHDARAARATRLARPDGAATPAPLPPPPALAPRPTDLPPPPPDLSIEDNLVMAEGLVGLAAAVGRDRLALARRAAIREALEPPPGPTFERVTAVVFPPGSASLTARERARLARALDAVDTAGPWTVRVGGSEAEARGDAVRAALVELGVAAAAIGVEPLERDVDVAEIVVRR